MKKIQIIILIIFVSFQGLPALCSINKDTLYIQIQKTEKTNDNELFKNALSKDYGNRPVKVTVKRGNYQISEIIWTKNKNTSIQFENNSIVKFANNKSGFVINSNNFTLENGTFIGNGIDATGFYNGYAFLIYGSDNVTIKNSSFTDISGNPIFLTFVGKRGCTNCKIINNTIKFPSMKSKKNTEKLGIILGYSGLGYSHTNNLIKDNYIDGNNIIGIGIGIIGHGKGNVIDGNTIENCLSYGILSYESQDDENTLTETTVSGNTVRNIGEIGNNKTVMGMGIYLMSSHNSKIIGNEIYNTLRNSNKTETLPAGAIALNSSTNTKIENNVVDNSNMYGYVNAYGFNSTFKNNTITNIEKSGVYLINVNDNIVADNTFKNIKEVVIKGYFWSTEDKAFSANVSVRKYKDIKTGNNISIYNNSFYSPIDVLYFTGQNGQNGNAINKIKNNRFVNNTIYNSKKRVKDTVFFREEVDNSNSISNNNIVIESK